MSTLQTHPSPPPHPSTLGYTDSGHQHCPGPDTLLFTSISLHPPPCVTHPLGQANPAHPLGQICATISRKAPLTPWPGVGASPRTITYPHAYFHQSTDSAGSLVTQPAPFRFLPDRRESYWCLLALRLAHRGSFSKGLWNAASKRIGFEANIKIEI